MEGYDDWVSILLVVIGCGLLIYGLYSIIILVKQYRIEAEEAKLAEKTDMASMPSFANGKYVVLTGKIAETNNADNLSSLIIYRQEKWVIHKDPEDKEWYGSWNKEKEVFPAFSLVLSDGEVSINSNILVRLGNEKQVSVTYTPAVGRTVSDIVDGSIRHVGFKAGDNISLLGTKGKNNSIQGARNEGSITPIAIVGGNRRQLLEYFDDLIFRTQNIGYASTVVGLIMLLFGLSGLR